MTSVTEAAKRIAARFRACNGLTPPCKPDCLCIAEAEKQLGVKFPVVEKLSPELDIDSLTPTRLADLIEYGGVPLVQVVPFLKRVTETLRSMEPKIDSEGNLPCPFCGGKVDPDGWLGYANGVDGGDRRGPECSNCGATAESLTEWNTRV